MSFFNTFLWNITGPTVPSVTNNEETVVSSKKKEKKKKAVRMAGGQAWEDNSLMEWDPGEFIVNSFWNRHFVYFNKRFYCILREGFLFHLQKFLNQFWAAC